MDGLRVTTALGFPIHFLRASQEGFVLMPPEQAAQLDRIERKLDWLHDCLEASDLRFRRAWGPWPGDLDVPKGKP